MTRRLFLLPVLALAAWAAAGLVAAPARAGFQVTGTAVYVDREFDYSGFTGNEPELPIRYADVEIVQSPGGAVLAEGYSDASGGFSIFVAGSGPYDLYVRVTAETRNARSGEPDISLVRVKDYGSGALFSVTSSVFGGVSSDLDIGILAAPAVTEGHGRLGNPFNMLDLVVDCLEYTTGPLGDVRPSSGTTITVRWPNTGSGSYASGTTTVIGYEAGYDDTIILHELGHVFHNIYSDSDNPGGSHGFGGTDQDPRLSFGEGWATYWEFVVRKSAGDPDPGIYVNTSGMPGPGNLDWHARGEDGSPYEASKGAASEWAIVCALWDMADDTTTGDQFPPLEDDDPYDGGLDFGGSTPEREMWEDFVGPVAAASDLTFIDFWDGWFHPVNHGFHPETEQVTNAWGIYFDNDADEPNNSAAAASAIAPDGTWSGRRTLYYSAADPPAPGTNDLDYYAFFVSAGTEFEVETRYDGGEAKSLVDPYLDLIAPNGSTVLVSADSGGEGRNAKVSYVSTQSGTHFARVREVHPYRDYGTYNLAVRILSVTAPPEVDSVWPDHGGIGGGTEVTITGANFVGNVNVYFGSKAATNVQVVDLNTLTARTPVGERLGPNDVFVENDNGMSDPLAGGYGYDAGLGLLGEPRIGRTVTLGASGTPLANWGLVEDDVLGPKLKKGLWWSIGFGPNWQVVANSFSGGDPPTNGLGQSSADFAIPDDPSLVGTSLYFESVYDNNGSEPGKELILGALLEAVLLP